MTDVDTVAAAAASPGTAQPYADLGLRDDEYAAIREVLDELENEGRVVARYLGTNPNGSARDIAAISNAAGNVVGIMPHPEHAVEDLTGPGTDGLVFFTSVLTALVAA